MTPLLIPGHPTFGPRAAPIVAKAQAFAPASFGTVNLHVAGRLDTTHADAETVVTVPDHGPGGHTITQSNSIWRGSFHTDVGGPGLHAYRLDTDEYYDLASGSFKTGSALAIVSASEASFTEFRGVWTEAGAADFLLVNSGSTNWRNAGAFGANLYVNGTKQVAWITPTSTIQSIAGFHAGTPAVITNYSFGRDGTSGSRTWFGDILELVVWDEVLSEANLLAAQAALQAVYGI